MSAPQNGDDPSSSSSKLSDPDPMSTQTQQEPTDPEDFNLRKVYTSVYKVYFEWANVDFSGLVGDSFVFPDVLRTPLNSLTEETIFHAAVNQNNPQDLKELVNSKYTRPQDLETPDGYGNTAFCSAIITGKWELVEIMIEKNPNLILIPGKEGMLPIYLAVLGGHHQIVVSLVNSKYTKPQDLETPNRDGNTSFCLAAIAGKWEFVEIMMKKNPNLPLIPGKEGMLPIHWAVLGGHHQIVEHMSTHDLLHKMARAKFKDIERLFFMVLNKDMYDLAVKLVAYHPFQLSMVRDDKENLTALHMLARKPPIEENKILQWSVVKTLRSTSQHFEYKERLQLITEPSIVVFDAVKSGNIHFVETFLENYKDTNLWELKDPKNGENLLHIAVLLRQNSIVDFILDSWESKHVIIREVDKNSNNALHFAARQLQETSASLRPDIQMQKELDWFKEVEKRVPPELSTMRNKDGKTPMDMFHAHRRKLSNEVKDTAKKVSESGMVVAALVVTVAFSAALTTPGDKTSAWFIVFIMANAIALFTSSLSIVAFLTIFTSSRFTEGDFVVSLYPSLIIGKRLLYISLVTMIIAFAAASFLIFGHNYKWVAYVVTSFGLLTIMFVFFAST